MAYGSPSLLSDRGRAWLGSVENVSPQQLPAHAEMAAKTGLMSFQDALMIKQMADQIRASGKNEGVPSNNVMQEKLAMLSGRPAPQPQMPPSQMQQTQQTQQMQPQQDPRMQAGLGAMPVPVMDNAQYADGGIVAFSGENGSHVPPPAKKGFWESMVDFYSPDESDRVYEGRVRDKQGRVIQEPDGQPPAGVTTIPSNPGNYVGGGGAAHPEWVGKEVRVSPTGRPYVYEPPRLVDEDANAGLGGFNMPPSTLKELNVDEELAKDDYSAYDKWAAAMGINPKEAAKEKEEDRRQALIMFGAKMAQASKDNDFFGAFGAGAEEYGKQTGESKKERRAAEKESKLARMNLEIGKGSEQRASRRSVQNAATRRSEVIAQNEVARGQLALQARSNELAEASRQASLIAARAGLPIQAAKAVGALAAARTKVLQDLRSSDPDYIGWADVLRKDPNGEDAEQARQELRNMEAAATATIDSQLNALLQRGYAGWSPEGTPSEDE